MNKQIYCGRKSGRMGDFDYSKLIMPAVVVVGGVILYNVVKSATPGQGTAANNAAINTNSAATADASLAAAQAAGQVVSIDETTLNGYATSLTNLMTVNYSFPVDADTATAIQNIVTQVNTPADWFTLVKLFGVKQYNGGGSQSLCSWFAIGCQSADLPSMLRIALPAGNISTINSYFSDTFGTTNVSI